MQGDFRTDAIYLVKMKYTSVLRFDIGILFGYTCDIHRVGTICKGFMSAGTRGCCGAVLRLHTHRVATDIDLRLWDDQKSTKYRRYTWTCHCDNSRVVPVGNSDATVAGDVGSGGNAYGRLRRSLGRLLDRGDDVHSAGSVRSYVLLARRGHAASDEVGWVVTGRRSSQQHPADYYRGRVFYRWPSGSGSRDT